MNGRRGATKQISLPFGPTRRPKHWAKPGPKPRAERAGFVRHVPRGAHDKNHPVHVVMRRVAKGPSLRRQIVATAIAIIIRRAVQRGIGVVHFSIQDDHLHLIVEAADASKVARGMQWLFSRIAFEVNRVSGRSGRLFRDRHFRHDLKTPSEVRRAFVYVLMNGRKHAAQQGASLLRVVEWLDPCSSAICLGAEAWHPDDPPPPDVLRAVRSREGPLPFVAQPRTWLAARGWQRGGGRIRFSEMPAMKPA